MILKNLYQLLLTAVVVASCWGSELDEIKDGSLGNRTRSVLTPSIEAVSISSTSPSSEGVGTTLVRKRRGTRRETTTRKGLSNILVTTPNADRCIDRPLTVQATISPNALGQPYSNPHTSAITRRMKEMGAIDKSDERGHIIASSLGGPAVPWNIFPQAPRMNRGPEPWDHASNAPPTWKQFEGKVRDFLALRGRRTVQYTIHFDYHDRRNPCRPSDVSASANLYDGGRLQRTLGGTYVNDNMNWG